MDSELKNFLEEKVNQYNNPDFITLDPISIPHRYQKKQDVEIMGLFASILAWGQRKTIINKCLELGERMDNSPYDFIINHQDVDLKKLLGFKHRTFNDTDLLYFVSFLKQHYQKHSSLEDAFLITTNNDLYNEPIERALINFRSYFTSFPDFPIRTRKHISSPLQKSSCKRLNMFLRWMVRKDSKGVDFGIWDRLNARDLICPCDVHVQRVARHLGLITTDKVSWKMAMELTENLRLLDPIDPVKYDFALFGIGVVGEM